MRIAVAYNNGNVNEHFGRTEEFKVYNVDENGKVVSTEILSSNGAGHEALAGVLAENSINALICGGMGAGAQAALADAGIEICAGASGDADAAVDAYLNGEIADSGVNCDHHDHEHAEGEDCGCGCGGDCSSGCGGGCGGAAYEPPFDGPNVGKIVKTHYCGTLDDGTQFDSSYDRGEPLEFVCGTGMMILGFDRAVANMQPGEIVNVHLEPEEAYGEVNPDAILTIDVSMMPGSEELEVGAGVYLQNVYGQPVPCKVTAREGSSITFDANHEMAGKALNFKIELVEVKEQ